MRSQRLKHKVEIQEQSTSLDAHGQPIETWTEYLTLRASIEPLMGRELYAAQQINSEVSTRIRIRYRAGINAAMRVLWGSRLYNILAVVNPREENKELLLTCAEGFYTLAADAGAIRTTSGGDTRVTSGGDTRVLG